MATGHQYYDGDGAPLRVSNEPAEVVTAWRSHRQRLRNWFARLPADRWAAPTRCEEWTVAEMAQHLAVGSKFLGYTLREARQGNPTELLRGFDPKAGPAALVAGARERVPDELLADLTET